MSGVFRRAWHPRPRPLRLPTYPGQFTFIDKLYNDGQTNGTLKRPGGTGDKLILFKWGYWNSGTAEVYPNDVDWSIAYNPNPTENGSKTIYYADEADIDDLSLTFANGTNTMWVLLRQDGDPANLEVNTDSTAFGSSHNPADTSFTTADYNLVAFWETGAGKAPSDWSASTLAKLKDHDDPNADLGCAYDLRQTVSAYDPGTITFVASDTAEWWFIAVPRTAGVTLDQERFRFRDDEAGAESPFPSTYAENTNLTSLAKNDPHGIRILIDASGDPAGDAYKIQWRKTAGTWADLE